MKKTLCLTSLLAIVATGAANATTDVTFAGDYVLSDGTTTANVGTDISSATYTYQKTDGSDVVAAYDVDPNLAYFTYTDKNGDPADLLTGGTNLTQSDFNASSVAAGDVQTTQTIAAGETISRDNYTYVDGQGNSVVLGESAKTFTETHDLLSSVTPSADYTIELDTDYMTSVDVTDGVAAASVDGSKYILHASNGQAYRLNEDGSELRKVVDGQIVDIADFPDIATELTALQAAYTADTTAIAGLVTDTATWAADEATAFAAANTVYNTDSAKINELNGYYGEYTDALTALDTAHTAQTEAGTVNAENIAIQTAARGLYNTSIQTTLDGVEQNAKDYAKDYADSLANNYDAAGSASAAEQNAKDYAESYADSLANNYDAAGSASAAEQNAKDYTDTAISGEAARVDAIMGTVHGLITDANATTTSNGKQYRGNLAVGTTVEDHLLALDESIGDRRTLSGNHVSATGSVVDNLQSLNDAIDTGDAATLASAQTYADTGDELTLNAAKAYADNANAFNLQAAKSYTDERIQKLDKDLSAGVASAVALSSVAVSNVTKGEVSVGAGYGYFNGQSAMAFGAAMGLSDRWSINTGAGLSGSDVSFRAGTNYKFKLF